MTFVSHHLLWATPCLLNVYLLWAPSSAAALSPCNPFTPIHEAFHYHIGPFNPVMWPFYPVKSPCRGVPLRGSLRRLWENVVVRTTKFGPVESCWHLMISWRHSSVVEWLSDANSGTPHRMSTTYTHAHWPNWPLTTYILGQPSQWPE